MAKQHQINVYFHNLWGHDLKNVTLKFTTSKPSIEEGIYTKADLAAGEKWGPLPRKYETGPDSEDFDFWYVEFSSSGEPAGRFKGSNKFACVIDSDVPAESQIDLWVSGKDRAFYTGYPESVGGRPGVPGYSGIPKTVQKAITPAMPSWRTVNIMKHWGLSPESRGAQMAAPAANPQRHHGHVLHGLWCADGLKQIPNLR